jgi:hypothetical protein
MNLTPTYDDVNLILRLYELRREPKMREARAWFISSYKPQTMEEHQALCPPGSENNAYFRMVTSYWDMVAGFVTSGVLHRELFFKSGRELLFVWVRIEPLVPKWREMMKSPLVAGEIEDVAQSYIQYLNTQGPQLYETFQKMVRGV